MSRFPFPMPFGWFKVAGADEVPGGEIVTRRYFGTELVLWRGKEGDIRCHDAFCAHLGAHLGVGGCIEGDWIRCPFHNWAYDGDGVNVDIPYADKTNKQAKLRSFPTREAAGIVLAWYHPHGEPPKYEPIEIPEADDPEWRGPQVFDWEIKTCLQEAAENGFDAGHFEAVHSHPQAGTIEEVRFDGYDRTVLSSQQFPSSRGPREGRIDIFGRGPGFAVTRYQGLIEAALVGASTPIDEETLHLWFHFWVRDPDGDEKVARIAKAFVDSVTSEVEQDIPIWEHKRYVPKPKLAEGEKPIMDFRRWFSQFYVDA